MKPHLIMPMGGAGLRFFKDGYILPKPLIEIHGKPFLYWSTMSIKKYILLEDLTFVVLRRHMIDFGIDEVIERFFPEANIEVIPEVLPGPVFTSMKGIQKISDDDPVIFNDCDHMFCCKDVNNILNTARLTEDAVLLTFESEEPQFSYVKYDSGRVVGTVEKKVVSNHAICGAYIFKNATIFKSAAEKYVSNCPYNECFMSGIYNVLCDEGKTVKDYLLDFHVEFGTPEEYENAKESDKFSLFE